MGRKAQDLTLTPHFTYLTVIERAPNIGRYVTWRCKCKCGKEIVVRATDLTTGNTKSCGCYKSKRMKEVHSKNVTGEKYGRLTVLAETDERNNQSQKIVLCQCECGTIKKLTQSELVTGNTKSCGCLKSIGEMKIAQLLSENNIEYSKEYIFKDFQLSTGGRPRFDFAIFNNGALSHLIEYDGIQHFKSSGSGWNTEENLQKVKQSDKEKNEYCVKHGIRLIRIKYDEGITLEKLL